MVEGTAKFKKRMLVDVPRSVVTEVQAQIEKESQKVAALMDWANPSREDIEIDREWTGKRTAAGSGRGNFSNPTVAITAAPRTSKYPEGFPGLARWFEYGTAPRHHKSGHYTGAMPAQPYFWPVWRGERDRVKRNLRNAARRGLKKA